MKVKSTKKLFIELTPAQAAAINGGRRGAGEPGDDRGNHGAGHP